MHSSNEPGHTLVASQTLLVSMRQDSATQVRPAPQTPVPAGAAGGGGPADGGSAPAAVCAGTHASGSGGSGGVP